LNRRVAEALRGVVKKICRRRLPTPIRVDVGFIGVRRRLLQVD
jgi:hypothetical protein